MSSKISGSARPSPDSSLDGFHLVPAAFDSGGPRHEPPRPQEHGTDQQRHHGHWYADPVRTLQPCHVHDGIRAAGHRQYDPPSVAQPAAHQRGQRGGRADQFADRRQVVKAVSSFCGPFIAAFAAGTLGNWQYLFPIFALITLLSAAWLMCTPHPRRGRSAAGLACRCDVRPAERPHGTPPLPRDRLRRRRRRGDEYRSASSC